MVIESIPVSSFMTRNVITETEDQNIQAVCKIMNENSIGSVVILKRSDNNNPNRNNNKKEIVGIITERDIVRIIALLQPSSLTVPIREFMSKPVITLSPNNSIKDAIQTMQLKNIRTLPVVENQDLQGIITEKDIFKAIMNNRALIPDLFSSNQSLMDRRDVFDQFSEYWFSDVLQRR
ncbi:MAG: CBS domain-containing protein [Thermoproteota archaeon]|nr:CBS domain-containing protein [Thermoproteota archaeon]